MNFEKFSTNWWFLKLLYEINDHSWTPLQFLLWSILIKMLQWAAKHMLIVIMMIWQVPVYNSVFFSSSFHKPSTHTTESQFSEPLFSEPQFSEILDLMNKLQLLFFIFHSLSRIDLVNSLDLVNKRGLTTIFTKSSLSCTTHTQVVLV